MRILLVLAQILTVGLVAHAGAFAQVSPWPMFRHDLHHSGRSPFTGASGPHLHWSYQANDGITSSPSLGPDGTIYVGAGGYYGGYGDSSLYALNPDGSFKWQYKTGKGTPHNSAGIFSSPAIDSDGTIYVGGLDGYLYCLEDSASYARLRWRRFMGNWPVYSSPAIGANGNIYVGGLDFRIRAFDPAGDSLWRYYTNWCVLSSPVVLDNGRVVVGSKDHGLYALVDAPGTPSLAWRFQAGSFYDGHLIDCSPAVADDESVIYFGTDPFGAAGIPPVPADTNFFAVNADGTLRWKFAVPIGVEGTPALGHDGTIYFGSYDSCLYALRDKVTHAELLWKFPTGGPIDACPTVDGDGTIYIGSRDAVLYAVNPDGSEKWRYETASGIESSVTIDDNGFMYFGSLDGRLYCLGTGAPDVGARGVQLPEVVAPGQSYVPTAVLANYRGQDADFRAICRIDAAGVSVYVDTVDIVALCGGATGLYPFADWTVGPDTAAVYRVIVHTVAVGDDNVQNDTAVLEVAPGDPSCCTGPTVGNIDGSADNLVTMGDLTILIDYLFISYEPVDCEAAANLDLSEDGSITMSDLTVLLDHLFISYAPLPPCP